MENLLFFPLILCIRDFLILHLALLFRKVYIHFFPLSFFYRNLFSSLRAFSATLTFDYRCVIICTDGRSCICAQLHRLVGSLIQANASVCTYIRIESHLHTTIIIQLEVFVPVLYSNRALAFKAIHWIWIIIRSHSYNWCFWTVFFYSRNETFEWALWVVCSEIKQKSLLIFFFIINDLLKIACIRKRIFSCYVKLEVPPNEILVW